MRKTSSNRHLKCPNCGSKMCARIIYGEYDLTEELHEALKTGKVILIL